MTKAIRIHQHGGPEVLKWEDVEVGDPGPGEVRVRHTAIGLNFVDTYHRTGQMKHPVTLPMILGVQGVGVVEATGPDAGGLKEGDRISYSGLQGSYSEARLAPADRLIVLPADISYELAAAAFLRPRLPVSPRAGTSERPYDRNHRKQNPRPSRSADQEDSGR